MAPVTTARDVLDREFLAIRARVLDLAAALDRIDRAGSVEGDARMGRIRRGLEILLAPAADRAEQVQHAFSLPYSPNWRQEA